jgi:phage host-nuclease inhibitor protein Gam
MHEHRRPDPRASRRSALGFCALALAEAAVTARRRALGLGHERHGRAAAPRSRDAAKHAEAQMAKRLKAPAAPALETIGQVVDAIAEIGRLQRQRELLEATMNEVVAAAKKHYEDTARPHGEEIKRLASAVQAWCEANRARLTKDGARKTARLASGEVRWRMTPPAVALRGVEAVIAALKAAALMRFLRTKEEVDKEAILKEPAAVAGIPGITVGQREEFVIVPFETKLEEVL